MDIRDYKNVDPQCLLERAAYCFAKERLNEFWEIFKCLPQYHRDHLAYLFQREYRKCYVCGKSKHHLNIFYDIRQSPLIGKCDACIVFE